MLAEAGENETNILQTLNKEAVNFSFLPNINNKISIFSKLKAVSSVITLEKTARLSFQKIEMPDSAKILLVACHLVAKNNYSNADQNISITQTIRHILEVEKTENCKNTIVIGDFNMNPFEKPMVKTTGFH
ncbi:MAG: hypothetical protein EAZ97_01260, partial [Bacteroidetes bacterium]